VMQKTSADPLASESRDLWLPISGATVGCLVGAGVYFVGGPIGLVFGCGTGAIAGFEAGQKASDVMDGYDGLVKMIDTVQGNRR